MTLSYRPFWSFDGRRMSLGYLSAGGRYTAAMNGVEQDPQSPL